MALAIAGTILNHTFFLGEDREVKGSTDFGPGMVLASPSAPASAAEVIVGNKLSNKKKLRAAGSLFEELVKVFFRSGGAFSSCIEAAGAALARGRVRSPLEADTHRLRNDLVDAMRSAAYRVWVAREHLKKTLGTFKGKLLTRQHNIMKINTEAC